MLTLESYIAGVRSGDLNPKEVIKYYQERAEKNELNARLSTTPTYVEEHFDQFLARPLCAAPIGIKDIIMTKGYRTTCGSKMLEDYVPDYDATCFTNLELAGGLMIGKNAMDEFAQGGSGENCAYGPTKNPWDHTRVPGGTSSGSAAAVANDECLASLGTDTGGSVRLPAAFCGVVGFKPTYGMISRYGVQSMANSFDQVGILAKTVEDAKILFDAVKGFDPMDMTSINAVIPQGPNVNGLPHAESDQIPSGAHNDSIATWKHEASEALKIAVFNDFFAEGIDPVIKQKTLDVIGQLKSSQLSARNSEQEVIVDFVDFPLLEYLVATYYIICPAEVSTNMARFDGLRYGLQNDTNLFDSLQDYYKYIRSHGFGPEVKRRLLVGSYVLSAGYQDQYYNKAVAVRNHVKSEYLKLYEKYDVVIGPTSPVWPWKIGGHANDPLADYLVDIYTVPANLIGAPAMSVPIGFAQVDDKKLPIGMHIMAKPGNDDKVFQMGSIIEQLNQMISKD